jgi:glycosyltransferase involved in cell wall biosynthesis
MMPLTILTTRPDVGEPVGGSSIRIAGYTRPLRELGVAYKFVSSVRPEYVSPADHVPFSPARGLVPLIGVHNILFHKRFFRPLVTLLRAFLLRDRQIRELIQTAKGTLLLAHQHGSVALFLKLTGQQRFIYDVHGILSLQSEYLERASVKDRFAFWVCRIEEKYVYKWADVVNAASKSMVEYLRSAFETSARFIIAPDGVLCEDVDRRLDQETVTAIRRELGLEASDRVLFFAGNFKKFGGVHHLVDAFCELAHQFEDLKLLLVGQGQMAGYVHRRIETSGLQERFVHIKQVPYSRLPYYCELATLIVCPDDEENTYNCLTPHIKVFDAIASGKPVVVTQTDVLEEIIPRDSRLVRYTSTRGMKDTIADCLKDLTWFKSAEPTLLQKLSYKTHAARWVDAYSAL